MLLAPYTPTLARMMPTRFRRWDSFSATNASRNEAKLAYITLNTQTPCPPRGAVPVNTRAWFGVLHSARPVRFRSWLRLPGYVKRRIHNSMRSVNRGIYTQRTHKIANGLPEAARRFCPSTFPVSESIDADVQLSGEFDASQTKA